VAAIFSLAVLGWRIAFSLRFMFCLLICANNLSNAQDELKKKMIPVEIQNLFSKNLWPGSISSRDGFGQPLFSREFDWDDQSRISEAIFALSKIQTEATWEELINCGEINSYCITLKFNGNPKGNYSVGRICRLIAVAQLGAPIHEVIQKHSSSLSPGYEGYLNFKLGVIEEESGVIKWRRRNPHMEFWQLQIEYAVEVAAFIENENLERPLKDQLLSQIKKQIAIIRATSRPIWPSDNVLEDFASYQEETAKKILDQFIEQNKRH
jgi:hypothetical protein